MEPTFYLFMTYVSTVIKRDGRERKLFARSRKNVLARSYRCRVPKTGRVSEAFKVARVALSADMKLEGERWREASDRP